MDLTQQSLNPTPNIPLIEWCGHKWMPQERWGMVHPQKSHWWYNPDFISIDKNGYLHLKSGFCPKHFNHLPEQSNISVGLVSCTTKFSYGVFEIEARLPFGENLWPAIWMYSWDSWPPEIDLMEGYSDQAENYMYKKPNIFDFFKKKNRYNIQSNVHYVDEGNKSLHDNELAYGVELPFDPTRKFVNYKCIWEADLLRIFYDDILVRYVSDRNILDKLSGHKMNVILNNGVTSFVDTKNPPKSDFVIKSFKYQPFK